MLPNPLLTELQSLRHQRPNCRVLVIEAVQDDVIDSIATLRNHNLPAGDGLTFPIIVLTARDWVRHRRKYGPVDAVIVHNQRNIARADNSPSYPLAVQRLREQPHPVRFITINPPPLLGVSVAPDGWACGDRFTLPVRYLHMGLPAAGSNPCGHINPHGTWHCEACGDFRGVQYEKRS